MTPKNTNKKAVTENAVRVQVNPVKHPKIGLSDPVKHPEAAARQIAAMKAERKAAADKLAVVKKAAPGKTGGSPKRK